MNIWDIIILLLFIPGIVRGLSKGFLEQGLSLAGIVLAVWMAFHFSGKACQLLQQHITVPDAVLRILGFVVVLVIVLIGVLLLATLATKVVEMATLGWLHKALGRQPSSDLPKILLGDRRDEILQIEGFEIRYILEFPGVEILLRPPGHVPRQRESLPEARVGMREHVPALERAVAHEQHLPLLQIIGKGIRADNPRLHLRQAGALGRINGRVHLHPASIDHRNDHVINTVFDRLGD